MCLSRKNADSGRALLERIRSMHRGAVETLTFTLSLHYVENARSMLERLEMTRTASRFKQYRPHNVANVHIIQVSN